ncbi:hypothetical protein RB623_04540 [Mesorhizobium sp. LHD-90]|uniref:hypothetical protein n=1 Tax=Mesorhizobium sp. LHD-90 TaxID=3071414 RepID=UPI0027E1DF1D|nr:hypothetical protein [Mesorhizobium sp. LHD-90]MDQ6433315.1 hypothetical protein [Mesorhizobium sp. LHD-90]
MTREEWKARSRAFERSAATLLANAHYDMAYHLAGIAVECALKARIAALFRSNDLPDKNLVDDIYRNGHNLAALAKLAGLGIDLAAQEAVSIAFRENWATVRAWSINSRYVASTQQEATNMMNAVARRGTGVLPWIRHRW